MSSSQGRMARFFAAVKAVCHFIAVDLWEVDLADFSRVRAVAVRVLRVISLVFKGFRNDECPLHAASLTLNTLMAIVPVLAISLSLARGFGGAEAARGLVTEQVHKFTDTFRTQATSNVFEAVDATTEGATNVVSQAAAAAEMTAAKLAEGINDMVEEGFNRVEQISFRAIGGVGLVLLLWMVIQMLGRVEGSFNRVWGVPNGRSVWRRFTDYLSVLVVLPLLVTAAASLPVLDMAANLASRIHGGDAVASFVSSPFARNMAVMGMSALAFTFMLWFMPNTSVRFWPAFTGGVVAALLFFAWLAIVSKVQFGVAKYGSIYGSFALVPILLLWVSFTWQILLFSAEVSFAVQNCETYRIEGTASNASMRASTALVLAILYETACCMRDGRGLTRSGFSAGHKISVRFLNHMLSMLVDAGYLGRLADEKEETYILRRAPERVTIRDVVDWIMSTGTTPRKLGVAKLPPPISDTVAQVCALDGSAIGERTLADLLES